MSAPTPDAYRGGLEAVERLVNRERSRPRSSTGPCRRSTTASRTTRGSGSTSWTATSSSLGPWRGPQATEHTRIPIGQGICGAAAATGRTEVVDDVNADDRYLACFVSTRSEIVVPITYGERVVGEIDIDSDTPAASAGGPTFLERVATLVSRHAANARAATRSA